MKPVDSSTVRLRCWRYAVAVGLACFTVTVQAEILPDQATTTQAVRMEFARGKGSIELRPATEIQVVSRTGSVVNVIYKGIAGRIPAAALSLPADDSSTADTQAEANARVTAASAAVVPMTVAMRRGLPPLKIPPREDLQSWLANAEYDQLDQLEQTLRSRPLAFYSGYSTLGDFYAAFCDFDGAAPDAQWDCVRNRLEQWVSARPDSVAALTSLGNFYLAYAWRARGDGVASEVTSAGWTLFRDRLGRAKDALLHAAAQPKPDVATFDALIRVATGLDWPRDKMEAVFNRGIAIEPNYQQLYEHKAWYLLPRWHGGEGDWQAFATLIADARGGEEGDLLYLMIVRSAAWHEGAETLAGGFVSYPRLQRGFRAALRRYPTSTYELNSYCYFACLAGDKPTARTLFRRLDGDWDASVWSKHDFEDALHRVASEP